MFTTAPQSYAADNAPPAPRSFEELGIDSIYLMTMMLKTMYFHDCETAAPIAQSMKILTPLVRSLLELAVERELLEILGTVEQRATFEYRYHTTSKGKEWVMEAFDQSQYVGPVPVTLEAYQAQIDRQRITNDRVDKQALADSLSHLVLPDKFMRKLGPAVNSGRALLLYGEPGNGKSSVAVALAKSFQQMIYVPHCVEVDGQIVKIFDPEIHTPIEGPEGRGGSNKNAVTALDQALDERWVLCERPTAITGGELTLEMLDLSFNPIAKYYEAPLQMKASGGIFVIDDFGRQIVSPQAVLNRWIVPLEKGYDYLTLHTGKKFVTRFDGLIIFSTNLDPNELMDAAMMRRVPYNLHMGPPTREEYIQIFNQTCDSYGLECSGADLTNLMNDLYLTERLPLARFHPRFIVEHVISHCQYEGLPLELTRPLMLEAAENLSAK